LPAAQQHIGIMFAAKVSRYKYIESKQNVRDICLTSVIIWSVLLFKYIDTALNDNLIVISGVLLAYFINALASNLFVGFVFINRYKSKDQFMKEPEL
jgi:hypothetical protein